MRLVSESILPVDNQVAHKVRMSVKGGQSRPGGISGISSHERYAANRYRNGESLKPTRRAKKRHRVGLAVSG
jgi:hypothetical protein